MTQLIVRYQDRQTARWGRIAGDAPKSAEDMLDIVPLLTEAATTSALLAVLDAAAEPSMGKPVTISASKLLSPITSDSQIFCQGLNYPLHAAEAQSAHRKSNLIFAKASSSLTGPYGNIVKPANVELLDYEIEFGIVFRKDLSEGVEITAENIGEFVAGVVLANDVSARDTMFGASFMQWFYGKSARTFCPVGPALWLLDSHEVADALDNIEISLWLNGELRQRAPSSALIWKPAPSINFIVTQMDMRRGDLLLTGTPGGITAGASPRLIEIMRDHMMDDERRTAEMRVEWAKKRPFMQPGDICTAELRDVRHSGSLGGLRNLVAAR